MAIFYLNYSISNDTNNEHTLNYVQKSTRCVFATITIYIECDTLNTQLNEIQSIQRKV